jgi:hypothetical protein
LWGCDEVVGVGGAEVVGADVAEWVGWVDGADGEADEGGDEGGAVVGCEDGDDGL